MQQEHHTELKKWDLRLLVLSILSILVFLSITIYLSNKSKDEYSNTKYAAYEKQILLGNIDYALDQILVNNEEAATNLKRFMPRINDVASNLNSNSQWRLLSRQIDSINRTFAEGSNSFEIQEQLQKDKTGAKTALKNIDRDINIELQIRPSAIKKFSTVVGELPSVLVYIGMVLTALSFLLLFYTIYKIMLDRSREAQASQISSQQNQEAFLELLDVMTALSEGDLTVQARVSDDITGTLADSFNYSVEELRGLVTTVTQSSGKVAEAVKESSSVTDILAKASAKQAAQISEATDTVMRVTEAMLDVSSQTSAAVDIAMSSTEVARSGSERVRSTIVGMDQIRDHIQETSKRIKRLGESSQEIGDIVELINDIADQTHILALNASIQASAAGDAGRGFAVVADEIQRLAERTGNATRRVENLVKTIQTDTNEAIFAMEKSTSEVVNGANLAERAGESLNEIESVSGRLATLIQNVSKASREVSNLGGKMKSSMDSIKELTEQNVDSTNVTTNSVVKISELANELRESVSGFKIK